MTETQMHRRRFVAAALGAAGAGLVAGAARAQDYPAPGRVIRLIVPFAPGGGVDVLARLYAEALKRQHGLTVVVENRGGASGTIGGQVVHQAAPDGYTLLFSASTHTTARLVMREVPYDPVTDFTPIARVGEAPMLVIVTADRPQKTIHEVVAAAKQAPGDWVFAASSLGSMGYLATVAFNQNAGLDLTITSYRGTAPALTDVAGGHVQLMIDPLLVLLPQARAGKVRALATTTAKRSALAPEVPTAAESGMTGLEFASWYGVWGPKGLPAGIVSWLNGAINAATAEIAKAGRFAQLGQDPVTGSAEDFARYIAADFQRSEGLLKAAKFQPI
ncbi:MAG TPA: tripartite tricarboxylate transporter substrate binding protein [Xanthobacteraceae bacterium]|jgi:tripartite-type tricarboxylate transporter receptor subunit TctC|nr:tripartite tricarboxylate transporter substrate binding protein [Xanthobacteraceae bacterium]